MACRCKRTARHLIRGAVGLGRAAFGIDRASPALIEKRLARCRACEHYNGQKSHQRGMERCRLCGCLLRAKARVNAEKCPADNWRF